MEAIWFATLQNCGSRFRSGNYHLWGVVVPFFLAFSLPNRLFLEWFVLFTTIGVVRVYDQQFQGNIICTVSDFRVYMYCVKICIYIYICVCPTSFHPHESTTNQDFMTKIACFHQKPRRKIHQFQTLNHQPLQIMTSFPPVN